jgi:hypothetical protein
LAIGRTEEEISDEKGLLLAIQLLVPVSLHSSLFPAVGLLAIAQNDNGELRMIEKLLALFTREKLNEPESGSAKRHRY